MPNAVPNPAALSAPAAARRLRLLTLTRWLPVGLTFGMTILLPVERGIPLSQVGVLLAMQGLVTLALEVPTGSIADTWGRRPLLLVAAAISLVSAVIFLLAHSFWAFALATALQGVYRALDSGPLESWYVDAAQAAEPGVKIERALTGAGTVLGLAIAGGALVGGALVAWHPLPGVSALVLPFAVSITGIAVHLVLTAFLVREPRRGWDAHPGPAEGRPPQNPVPDVGPWTSRARAGLGAWGRTIGSAAALLRTSPVLRALVLVELFWSLAMLGFETLTPLRLSALLGSEAQAAAVFAPASAAAWGLFSLGSWAVGLISRRWGVAPAAMVARVVNGLFVAWMGLTAGVVGLLAAYGLAYLSHGAAGPVHNTLLHRCATAKNRSVVLSLNSMVASGVYSIATLVALPLAEGWGTGPVLVALGLVSTLGALLYVPAWRRERAGGEHHEA